MKKLIIGAICIILLTGCGSEKNVKQQDTKQVEQQVENNAICRKPIRKRNLIWDFRTKLQSNWKVMTKRICF